MSRNVTIFSRRGCHLCEVAMAKAVEVQAELGFSLQEIFIDGDQQLTEEHGEKVPVIYIDGKPHDFFRIDEVRFRSALR